MSRAEAAAGSRQSRGPNPAGARPDGSGSARFNRNGSGGGRDGGSSPDGAAGQQPASLTLRGTGTARWVLAAAVFGAVLAGSLGMHGVVLGWGWIPRAAFTVGVVLSVIAAARRVRPLWAVTPLLGLAALCAVLTLVFFADTAVLGVLPTDRTLAALGALLQDTNDTIVTRSAPVPLDDGLAFIICAGLGLAALLIDTLAVVVTLPAASGLGLLLLLLVPALVKTDSVGFAGFAGAALGYLLILGCCHWYLPDGKLRRTAVTAPSGQLRRAAGLALAAVLAMAAVPLVVPGFSDGLFPQGSRLTTGGNVSGIDPMISLGNDLRAQGGGGRTVYFTTSDSPVYLRMTTLEDFSGRTWQPAARNASRRPDLGDITDAFGPAPGVPTTTVRTLIYPESLDSPWLPVPYAPRRIDSLFGAWSWDPETLSVKAAGGSALGQRYQVESVLPQLSKPLLRQADAPPRKELDPIFLKLPDRVPAIIKETADRETAGARTRFDQALALQQYLRSDAFTYSEQTPLEQGYDGAGLDVVAKFLQVRSGYCVHFSAAMAVMARELGIPSRIAVGYSPGSPTAQVLPDGKAMLRGYAVDGRNAHAWPELYFEGLGWVPFEPTPSRGQVPAYAEADFVPTPGGGSASDFLNGANGARPSGAATNAPTTPAAAPAPAASSDEAPRSAALTAAAVLVLALLAAPGLLRTAIRRRRLALIRGSVPGPWTGVWAGFRNRVGPARLPRAGSRMDRSRTDRSRAGPARMGRERRGRSRTRRDAPARGPVAPEVVAWRELLATAVDYGFRPEASATPRRLAEAVADLSGAPAEVAELSAAFEGAVYGRPGTVLVRSGESAEALERIRAALHTRATAAARLRAVLLPPSLFRSSRG